MVALADWKKESSYPPIDGTLMSRWHWEFLRRNKTYQDDYNNYKKLRGEQEADVLCELMAKRYGLEGIMLDYRDPLEVLFQSPREKIEIRLAQWQTAWIGEDENGILIEGKTEQMDYLDPKIRQHECCVVFNLRHDLEQQLKEATERVRKIKQRYMERRGRVEHYPYYLMLIDADEEGVSPEELVAFFLSDIEKLIAMKKIKNDLKEAKRLRDVGYQYI